jgi:MFS family permease
MVSSHLINDDAVPTRAPRRPGRKRKWRGIGVPPRAPLTIGAIALITGIADEAITDRSTLFMRRELEASPLVASLAYAVYSLVMLVGRLCGDSISNRLPPMRILQISGTMGAIGMIGGAVVSTPTSMLVGIGVIGLGFSVIYPPLYRFAGTTPNIPRATGLVIIATIAYLGFLAGPLVVGPLVSMTSLRTAFISVGGLCILIAVLGHEKTAPERMAEAPRAPSDLETPPEPNPYSL